MKTSLLAALSAAMIVCGVGSAHARGDRDIGVFPLAPTGVQSDQADIPDALSEAIAKRLHAKLAKSSAEDIALGFECSVDSVACLAKIMKAARAEVIVHGQVIWNDMTRKLKVVVTKFEDGKGKTTRSYVLDSLNAEDAEGELMTRGEEFFRQIEGDEEEVIEEVDCRRHPDDPSCPEVIRDPKTPEQSGPTTGTYALIVGGGVAIGVGAGFRISAIPIRNEIDALGPPQDYTFEKLQRAKELENQGTFRVNVGNTLIIAGAALATYGIVRAIQQRKPAGKSADPADPLDPDSTELSLAPLPDGAAFVISGRFP